MPPNLKRIFLPAALLAASLVLFEFSGIDLWLQDQFFNADQQRWLVEKKAWFPKLLFYTGPKVLLIGFAVFLLAGVLWPKPTRPSWLTERWSPRRVWLVILSLAIIPGAIGFMKARSDVYVPWALARYGGDKPYHRLFEPLPPGWPPNRGHGFPAGHASGGFALMSLSYLSDRRTRRWTGLAVGLTAGWTMGLYQMLKGAHFLSHTVATMLLAWLTIELLALLLGINPSERTSSPDCDPSHSNAPLPQSTE